MLLIGVLSAALSFVFLFCFSDPMVQAAGPSSRNALAVARGGVPEGYEIGTLKFRGTLGNVEGLEVDGRDIMEIIEKVQIDHPELELSLEYPPPANTSDASNDSALKTRNKNNILCCPTAGQNFVPAYREYIDRDVAYLYGLHGNCGIEPRTCTRIACDQGQAIFLCNDNDYFIEPECGYIASYAQDITQRCSTQRYIDGRWQWLSCGQEFDTDNYNVIVAFQSCARDSHVAPGH